VVLCVLTAFILAGSALAQEAATIAGTVTDTTGALVPGAAVTISNGSGFTKTVTTNDQGEYSVEGLAAGAYDVTISLTGFSQFQATGFELKPGQSARLDATLEPAKEVTSINVAAEKAAEVETQTAQITGTITQKQVTAIGLNGRNFTQLITLAPGVSNQTGQDEALVGVKGSVK